jgi:hypothetical protein
MKRNTRSNNNDIRLERPDNLDPWELIWGQPYIDADRLATAIEIDLKNTPAPDFRTRLLVRDASRALRLFWGARRFEKWLGASSTGGRVRKILQEALGKPGFRYIRRRLVANPNLVDLQQLLEILGQSLHRRVELNIAGSIPTLVRGLTARPTDDIDIVDEVPIEVKQQREKLAKIKAEYGLVFGHVQSHYLPANWQERRQFLGDFGRIRAYLVDPYDIFVSKLSSKLEKHKQDLRVLAKTLDRETAEGRLFTDGAAFINDPHLRPQIEKNWQFIFQEPLRTPPETKSSTKKTRNRRENN